MAGPVYRRVVIKLSGEYFAGPNAAGFDQPTIDRVAGDLIAAKELGVEIAVVIGRKAKNVSRERALDYVLGYTCANDVSARDWQKQMGGSQWCRGKTFDTFCPLGPGSGGPRGVMHMRWRR